MGVGRIESPKIGVTLVSVTSRRQYGDGSGGWAWVGVVFNNSRSIINATVQIKNIASFKSSCSSAKVTPFLMVIIGYFGGVVYGSLRNDRAW